MEYYSAIKKNESMLFAEKWMELEIAMLSEDAEGLVPHVFSHMQNLDLKKTKGHEHKRGTIWWGGARRRWEGERGGRGVICNPFLKI
jgi:hypothetical protein